MRTRTLTSCIALSTAIIAAPAFADVTVEDVFANQQALYTSLGMTLSGTLTDGMLVDPQVNAIFPMGSASFKISLSDISMQDNGDGTVSIEYPSPLTVSLAGGVPGEGSGSGSITFTHNGYTITASGEPGNVAYTSTGSDLQMDIVDVTVDDDTIGEFDMIGSLTISNWAFNTNVVEGDLLTYTSTSEVGDAVINFLQTVDGLQTATKQTTTPTTTSISAQLPSGGSDLMNLSAALRDGLRFEIDSVGGGNGSESVTTINGDMMMSQSTAIGAQEFLVSLSEEALILTADTNDVNVTMNNPLIFPGDLEFGLASVSADYDLPVNASEMPQDFRLAVGMNGLTLGDTIWNMFDPAMMLPRDPADLTFDITGNGMMAFDLLDFAAMSEMFGPPPATIDDVTIENLRIAAAGAEATAVGAMTFDWTDFQTIPGMPRPEGAVTVNLNGANQLMDTLVAMGLIPEADLMMPRMMMGMFATPVGDDMLETVLEVNEQGHVLANGQRLQ